MKTAHQQTVKKALGPEHCANNLRMALNWFAHGLMALDSDVQLWSYMQCANSGIHISALYWVIARMKTSVSQGIT